MTSINTNVSAMAALSTLRTINNDMESTQSRISSGLKVGQASDNAAYWSISTTIKSDNKALATVQDALGLGAAKTDVAYTAMDASIKVVDEIKAKLVAASEPGVDKAKVQKDITELQNQLKSISKSAAFSGENWVQGTSGASTKSIVGGFNRDSSNAVSLTTLDFDTSKSLLVEVDATTGALSTTGTVGKLTTNFTGTMTTAASVLTLDISATGFTAADLTTAISGVDSVLQSMTDAGADLGALNKRITLQTDFVSDLTASFTKGVGRLVDADMNEESTRLKALQTQQQLGIQSLSIANSDAQNILSLFR
ncbi:flagellin [Rhizobium sp. PP-F2F-G36]|nr:flagellin [Rhizobium sp. PP-F2F-G36]